MADKTTPLDQPEEPNSSSIVHPPVRDVENKESKIPEEAAPASAPAASEETEESLESSDTQPEVAVSDQTDEVRDSAESEVTEIQSSEPQEEDPAPIESTDHSDPSDPVTSTESVEATPVAAPQKRSHRKLWLTIGLVFILLLNAGMGGAGLYLHRKAAALQSKSAISATAAKPANNASSDTSSETDSSSLLHYVSTPLHIEFDYPVSWRIGASASNNSIDLTSEQFSFTDSKGATRSGNLFMSINAKDNNSKFGYLSGDAKIAADSKSLSYKSPTSLQRKVTNLTYVLDRPTDSSGESLSGVDHLLVTGGMAYTKGQNLSDKDYLSTDPQIYAYINSCPESACKYLALATVPADEWNTNENLKKVQDLIASIMVMK